MTRPVKLTEEVMSFIRREALLQGRSIAGQITHWIKIGRVIEESPTFDYQHITTAMVGKRSPDDLSAEEQAVWFSQLSDDAIEPAKEEEVFFAKRRQLGRGVGLTDRGDLIYQTFARV